MSIRHLVLLFAGLLAGLVSMVGAEAAIAMSDDDGNKIVLKAPAARVISLAPNLTELMYAIGAGDHLVAVSAYSDYPPAARKLPRVGNANAIDIERIVSLKPDLVLAWKNGTPRPLQQRLRELGMPVFTLGFRKLGDIGEGIDALGRLTGRKAQAARTGKDFRHRLEALRQRYADREPVRVFFQIWDQPLMTVNRQHLLTDMIRSCGGRNVFADLGPLTSAVGTESIIGRSPEAIVASTAREHRQHWLQQWRRWDTIPAVHNNDIFFIEPDLVARPGPRVLQGAEKLCRHLETVRRRRNRP